MVLTAEHYRQQLEALLPPGLALTIEPGSNTYKLFNALGVELARIDARNAGLLSEMNPSTTDELLPEWEASLNLPDGCINPPRTKAGRRAEIISRLTSTGGQSRQYFIDVASAIGYTVTITEPSVHAWQTHTDIAIRTSHAGGPCGEPLRTYRGERTMECRFLTDKPSHSVLSFDHQHKTGENWIDKTSGTSEHLRSVWYDETDGLWVICGNQGVILTSTDGETWTARSSGTTNSLRTVKKWKNNWYIVGHGDGANPAEVLTSTNGINWSPINIGGGESYLVTIAFNDDVLLFAGFGATSALLVKSVDGQNFNVTTLAQPRWGYGLAWNEEDRLFGFVGGKVGVLAYFATSSDGDNWLERNTDMATEIWVVDHVDGNWILGTGAGEMRTSPDAQTFKARNTGIAGQNIWRITHNNRGVHLLSGGFTTGLILRSIDGGATWTQVYTNGAGALMSKAWYGDGFWIAVGWGGKITKSIN